ncbi:hypothetical protein GE061_020161 [Apolygus lucorum]|uniref:Nuclear pore complex protein Nup153 n=1 Tax=Apolygus lucorum TaxID=248454 RepID=A0A8S9WMF0_APOLU|nr:hypothetical protein GE061_020161 [Apolygus lucorum]
MAKGSNNVNPKRSHLYKPYDSANSSLFSRLTTRVSEILPQPTSWLSRWTAPVGQHNFRADSDEDDDDSNRQQQPPSKRICVRPPSNDVSTQQNQNHVRQIRSEPELSPILRNRTEHLDRVVAGPSGLNLRGANFVASTPALQVPTEAPVKVNGDEGSDGSESTSGCSSLVPQGERTLTAPFPENTPKASPETPMLSITPSSLDGRRAINKAKNRTMNMSYSFTKSRPAFDAYAFNNPLNKSSSFNSSFNRMLDDSTTSPFYRGRTMYGGNSSCKESLSLSLTSPKVGTPRLVSVRPTPIQNRDTISTSALKILRAIEQFSTPVLDTKKIPLKSESDRRKRKAPQPFEDLVIPTMPDLLRIKRKERTQSESSGAPSIPPAVSTPKPYQLPPPVQPLSVRDDAPEPKRVMKGKAEEMKTEQVEKVNLPSIPLPIKTLPSFSHLSSLPTSSTYSTPATASVAMFSCKPVLTTSPSQASPLFSFGATKTNESTFKFAQPLVDDTVVPTSSIKPKLQFRNPLNADAPTPKSIEPSSATAALQDVPVLQLKNNQIVNFSSASSSFQLKLKKPQESVSSSKTSGDTNAGSVVDFFNKDKNKKTETVKHTPKGLNELFKPATGSWTCDTCLVSNSEDKSKCSCCETPKPSKKEPAAVNSVSVSSAKMWSCSKCSYKNEESSEKCVCGLKKGEKSTVLPLSSLKEFAKAPSDTWECKECFVRNKSSDSSCVACSTAKPGAAVAKPAASLSSMFKKPEGAWECSVCMVSNKSADSACVACGTTKPGSAPAPMAKPAFSFGIPPAAATTSVNTPASAAPLTNTATVTAASTFSFGVPSNATENTKGKTSSGFGGFKFGGPVEVSSKPSEETKEKPVVVPASTFTFGSVASQTPKKSESIPTVVIDDDDDAERPQKKKVSFGVAVENVAKPLGNTANAEAVNKPPSFAFGATKTEPSTTMFQFASGATSSAFGSSSGAASSSTDAKTSSENAFKFGNSSTGVSSSTDLTTTAIAAPTPTPSTVASGFGMFANVATNASKSLFPPENKPETSFGVSTNKPAFLSSSEPKAFGFGKNNDADTSKVVGTGSALFGKRESSNTLFGMPPPPENKPFYKTNDTSKAFFNSESNENKNIFAAKPIPAFGASTNSVFELKPATTVSNSSAFSSAPVAPATVFGSQTAILNNSEQKPMAFGAMQSTPSSDSPFMFKGTDAGPKTSGGFSFSAPTPGQPAAPQNAFGYNSAETPKFGASVANAAPTPLFGSASAAPIFNNPTPSPSPFAFVAAQPVEQQAPSPAFGFPAAQPQAAASPFSFNVQNSMSTPTPAQPTTFDPNVKPCFNFTGGATPNFAATPSINTETKQPDRKIRKAVRRSQIPR